jgi:hypothetical protein
MLHISQSITVPLHHWRGRAGPEGFACECCTNPFGECRRVAILPFDEWRVQHSQKDECSTRQRASAAHNNRACPFAKGRVPNRAGHQMEIDGIGICSCYTSWPALKKRDRIKCSDKGGDGVAPPSCSQSLSHRLEEKQLIHEHLFRRWRARLYIVERGRCRHSLGVQISMN